VAKRWSEDLLGADSGEKLKKRWYGQQSVSDGSVEVSREARYTVSQKAGMEFIDMYEEGE
jgi:hypothetical protein